MQKPAFLLWKRLLNCLTRGYNISFPVFDSKFSVVLVEETYLESDHTQFTIANETLYQSIQENPDLAKELGLSQYDVQAVANGTTPEGYVWHHTEQPGVLQLVNGETHQNTGHTGGRELWEAEVSIVKSIFIPN